MEEDNDSITMSSIARQQDNIPHQTSDVAHGLPAFFGSMSLMDDTTIESAEEQNPRRSHHPFSFDDYDAPLSPVEEENDQKQEDIFRERFGKALPSPTLGRSRAVSFDQRFARIEPPSPQTRKRSTSEYKVQDINTALPFSNIFNTYFDEGLSDTIATSRESLSVPSSPYTPARRPPFSSSDSIAPGSSYSGATSGTNTPLNPWSREFHPKYAPISRSSSASMSPQQQQPRSAEASLGTAKTPASLIHANIYSPEYLNPEFYAATGGSIGGTLGGLYSSYGYVPPKIESADGMVYQVKFKYVSKFYLLAPAALGVTVGDYVKVEADRGEDIGLVISTTPLEGFKESRLTIGRHGLQHGDFKHVIRAATDEEKYLLPLKLMEEEKALEICRDKVFEHRLNMRILDAEYQFDRHKLIFYFDADKRVDFRAMVSDLFALYKTRIWMQQAQIKYMPNELGEIVPQLVITKQFASP